MLEDSPTGVASGAPRGSLCSGSPRCRVALDDADELFDSLESPALLARLGLASRG